MAALIAALFLIGVVFPAGVAVAETKNLTSTADTQLAENSPTANYGGNGSSRTDGDDPGGSGKEVSSLLKWDLSAVPAGSRLDSATVTVTVTNPSPQTYQAYDLKQPWVEAAATWQQYASGQSWEEAGAKGSLDRGAQVGSLSAPTTGNRTFSLSPALVQEWIDDPSSNRGIVIANAANTDGVVFFTREAADASLRPSLSVNYSETPAPPPTDSCAKGEFRAQYHNEAKAFGTQPVLTRCEPAINNDWGSRSPASGVDADLFTTRWVGTFDFEASDYEFTATADDGVRLWVDGQPLIDQWKDQAATTYRATRTMTAGQHEVKVEYYENAGAAVAKVSWAKVAQPPPSPPPSGTDSHVCAHWFVGAQNGVSGTRNVAAYEEEIRKAKAMGLDCFAYNVIDWQGQQGDVANLYTAANNVGGFYLFPSPDFCCSMSEANLDAMALDHYNDPARLRVDGGRFGDNLPVTSTWHGEDKGAAAWNRIQSEWRSAGKRMFFMPYFYDGPYGGPVNLVDVYNGANNSDPADDTVDGLYNFGGFASGENADNARQDMHSFFTAVDASPGMDMMWSCGPVFNRHSGTGEFDNRILGDFEGYHSWRGCLQGYVQDQPRFMEFTTWNDYLEGTYIGGPYTNSQLSPDFRGNNFSHNGFRKVGAYYIESYQAGSLQPITKDLIALAHRPHPENVAGVHPYGSGILDDTDNSQVWTGEVRPLVRQRDYAVVEDRLYSIVMLKGPGTVVLHSGSNSQSFAAPAGISEFSMPFSNGVQSIELRRSGTSVLSAQSGVQINSDPTGLFNYNVETTYAEGP
jgi:hypothetical protein